MGKNKYGKLIANSTILAIGTFSSKVLVFLLMPLYSSVFATGEFGVADLLTQTANLLEPLVTIGMCSAVFRFAFGKKPMQKTVFTTGILSVVFGIIVLILFSPLLKKLDFLTDYMYLMIVYILMYSMHMLCANFLRGKQQVKAYAFKGVLCTVCTILFNILFLVVFDMGVTGYLLSNILADAAAVLYMFWAGDLLSYFSIKSLNFKIGADMARYAIPLIPTTIFWLITNVSDRYIVKYIMGESATGLFAMAYKLPNIIVAVAGVFFEAWQMSMVEEARNGKLGVFFSKVYESFKSLMFILAGAIIFFVKIITKILLQNDFYEAWRYIPLLVVATVCTAFVSFTSTIYIVRKKSVNSLICASIGALCNIVFSLILIRPFGINGAAFATFLSYLIVYFVTTYRSLRYVRYHPHVFRTIISIVLLLVQSFIVIFEAPLYYLFSGIVYALILYLNFGRIYYVMSKVLNRFLKKKKN